MSPAHATMYPMLTDTDRAILDLAANHPNGGGGLTRAARTELDMMPTRYYQRLDRIIRTRDGIAYDPQTCRRMRAVADGV